jgi:lipopolysaccharide assembly protein A
MSTEPQPIPTPTPASVPLPRPAAGAPAPVPGPDLEQPPVEVTPPDSQVPAEPVPDSPVAPGQTAPPQTPPLTIKRTRISGLWVAVGFFAVVLLLLLIFILQNGTKVQVSYMGAHGHLPLGVALLLAAVCGVLLVVLAGAARISQLRTVARRHRRADRRNAKAAQKAAS